MGRLIDKLLQEAQEDNRNTARELVSNADNRSQPTRHGFSDAVAESNAQLCERLEHEAVARLRSGTVVHGTSSMTAFRDDFARLGRTKVDELLLKYT